jgi:hypothetical protein
VPVLRIDNIPIEGALLGVWKAAFRRVFDFKDMSRRFVQVLPERTYKMKTIRFVVKVSRGGRAAEYVQRVDPSPIHLTTNPKLALLMARLTAEDAVESLGNSRCNPELLSVPVA